MEEQLKTFLCQHKNVFTAVFADWGKQNEQTHEFTIKCMLHEGLVLIYTIWTVCELI